MFGVQDFMVQSQGMLTQAGFGDRTQDGPSTQKHYGIGRALQ